MKYLVTIILIFSLFAGCKKISFKNSIEGNWYCTSYYFNKFRFMEDTYTLYFSAEPDSFDCHTIEWPFYKDSIYRFTHQDKYKIQNIDGQLTLRLRYYSHGRWLGPGGYYYDDLPIVKLTDGELILRQYDQELTYRRCD
jgi:hypothetical protein